MWDNMALLRILNRNINIVYLTYQGSPFLKRQLASETENVLFDVLNVCNHIPFHEHFEELVLTECVHDTVNFIDS